MTPSEQLIADALKRAQERAGARVKIRLPSSLHTRAEACAAAVGDDLAAWCNNACLSLRAGRFDGVSSGENAPKVTRADSRAVWLRAPAGMPARDIRRALSCAVVVAEAALKRIGGPLLMDWDGKQLLK